MGRLRIRISARSLVSGLALHLHNFYTGAERIFYDIARDIDGEVPTAQMSHPADNCQGVALGAAAGAATGGLLTLAGGLGALFVPGIGLALAAESVLAVLLGMEADNE